MGVRVPECSENRPSPALFLAATLKMYAVPFVRPVTVAEVAVEATRLKVVQVLPLSLLYWMT